ncbi:MULTISPECIES: alpha/beta fold hydrolase [Lonsdalea]|uniref:Arylesterase n=1 Tax=Lonsdalea populi TaxID=1172565 RepID=A0ABX9EN87_9GAMM|nr:MULTISPECIES: alpha/beta hydrolase [Lonsdalea]OSN00964.1 arylesterase [Lonsdalea populi]QPQ23460.1 alpha/beta hydrolase [Lonsdalea populi]RAT15653.1 arylesterase [Lonsdalea quercina]RAT19409.1 arylesterase [Lonsdalea populi]RAT25374.1 arylesterase [Lonsdalea populi]
MSTFRTKDGTQLYYKDWGKGKPLLFSHGWPLDADMWDSQLHFFAEHGFRAVAFDRRGFGRSDQPWNGYHYDTLADDIHELIEHLQLDEMTLIGFSMGGGDVSRYLHRHGSQRVSALVLLSAVTPKLMKSAGYPNGVEQQVIDGIREGIMHDRAQFISDFSTPFYGLNKGMRVSDAVLTQTLNIALLASLKSTHDCVTAFSETDFRPDMHSINVPTLVIHGDADQVVPFESTGKVAAEMIKNAQLKVYEGAPHAITQTHRDRLNQDLLAFMRSVD